MSDAATPTDHPSFVLIAIDGPAGSGKSTVGKALARALGLEYLDTGAMYRGVTFAALRRGIDPSDAEVVGRLARQVELEVDESSIHVDGVDATIEIRGPEVTRAVSLVAAVPAVMAFNFFARKIKVLTAEMDAFANDFLNIVKRHFLR